MATFRTRPPALIWSALFAHVREASLSEEGANARSVNQLVRELTGMERFFESLKPKPMVRSGVHEL